MGKVLDELGEPAAIAVVVENSGEIVPIAQRKLERGDSLYTLKQVQHAQKLNMFSLDAIHTQLNFLMSDTLTIVEASFSDPLQRQAVVKLVKSAFNKRHEHIDDITGNGRGSSVHMVSEQ